MGQASSTVGGNEDVATSDAATDARGPATRFAVQPLTPSLKVVRSLSRADSTDQPQRSGVTEKANINAEGRHVGAGG